MTRRIFLSLLLLISTQLIFAQKPVLKEEQIIGSWKMTAFNMAGIYLDFAKDSIDLSAELKAQIDSSKLEVVKNDIKRRLAPYTEGHIRIGADKKYSQTLMGETASGTYSLVAKDGAYYLHIINNNRNKDLDEMMIWKDKGWLYLSYLDETGERTTMIFERTGS
jgi:hypothetical protein